MGSFHRGLTVLYDDSWTNSKDRPQILFMYLSLAAGLCWIYATQNTRLRKQDQNPALLLSLACCSFKRPCFLDRGGNHAILRSACAHDYAPDNSTPFSCTVLVPGDFHTLQLYEFRWNSSSTHQRNTIKERLEDSLSPNKFVPCDMNLPCSRDLGWCTGNTGPNWK